MWLIPAVLCALYVKTYQQDIIVPSYLTPYYVARSKHVPNYPQIGIPENPHNRHVLPNYPAGYVPPQGEKPYVDVQALRYLLKRHEKTMRELGKSNDVSYEDYKNVNPLLAIRALEVETKTDLYTPKAMTDEPSFYDDLELVEQFGNYLRKKTQINPMLPFNDDAGRQYNALLAVLIALAKIIRSTCSDIDVVYDMVYLPTVEKYYVHGLHDANKISGAIEEYIRKGNSHIPKLLKLKKDLCKQYINCATALDEKVKNNLVVYSKEVETLESLVHLARTYYGFSEEFNNAALTGTVMSYLQNNKDRVKDYTFNVVNSVDHLSDKVVKCR